MEFDLQRFAPAANIYGNKTLDGSRIEAYIYNPRFEMDNFHYEDIAMIICYTYTDYLYTSISCGGGGNYMLYKTQHKWGGGIYS